MFRGEAVSIELRFADPASLIHQHARRAIEQLGARADLPSPSGALLHFGQWLDWPDWLYDGTSLPHGPLPVEIRSADDILITANLLDRVGEVALIQRVLHAGRVPAGPVSSMAMLVAPTLGDALDVSLRLIGMNSQWHTVERVDSDDHVQLEFRNAIDLGPVGDFAGLIFLASAYGMLVPTVADLASELELDTTYCDRPDLEELWALFDCRVRAGAPVARVRFPASWIALRNPQHDPAMWQNVLDRVNQYQWTRCQPDFPERVRARIARILSEQRRVPRLKQVAAEEGWSERTLVRRLSEHGVKFHAMVEDERRTRAATLINDPMRSLADVAAELGFTDMSSFARSFRAWFGESPGRMRKRAS